ncbi:MAG: hypothetical protein P4L51_26420 [Puia sp.]|nr:hypothetical protein [Puia sp.]
MFAGGATHLAVAGNLPARQLVTSCPGPSNGHRALITLYSVLTTDYAW